MTQPLILAITTIGDLLLKNRITKDKNNKPIENVQLVILLWYNIVVTARPNEIYDLSESWVIMIS